MDVENKSEMKPFNGIRLSDTDLNKISLLQQKKWSLEHTGKLPSSDSNFTISQEAVDDPETKVYDSYLKEDI